MKYLTTNERKIQLLLMLSETNSQDGSVEGQEFTAYVFIHLHLMPSSAQSNSSDFKHLVGQGR